MHHISRVWRPIPAMALILGSLGLTGCTSIAKQGLQEVLGARAERLPVTDALHPPLAGYGHIAFSPATTTLPARLCPPTLLSAYDRYAARLTRELTPLYPGDEPGVVIDTEVLYYQKKGLMGAGQFLTRVRMRAGDQQVFDMLVNATTKSFREGAADDLAEAAIKSLGQFLREQKAPPDADRSSRRDRD